MYTSEDLKNLLNEPFEVLSEDINKLQRLVQYYQQIYGVDSCVGCGGKNKYQQFYLTLKDEGVTIMETKENTSFLFNKGVTLVPMEFGSNRFVTPTNLTDELAIEFLAKNKNRISLFEKYPEDWETQIAEFEEKQAEAAATETEILNPDQNLTIEQIREQLSTISEKIEELPEDELNNTEVGKDLTATKIHLTEELKRLEAATGDTKTNKKSVSKNK